jgi:hypothetical protein
VRIAADTAYALIARTMRAMLVGRLAPGTGGARIWRAAGRALDQAPRNLSDSWTLWGALTEPTLVDSEIAPSLMLRAAAGWLALPDDDWEAREAYLDRWLFEELGYGATVSPEALAVHPFRRLLAAAHDKSTLTPMLPKHSGDVASAQALVALGYPAVAPVLPHLFQWLETSGSPVEVVLRPFFAGLGAPARDLACQALLHKNKPARKETLLRHILPAWPRKVVATLPLEGFLYDSDFHGLDVWALKLMTEKRIPTHDGLRTLSAIKEEKTARLRNLLQVLDDLALPT